MEWALGLVVLLVAGAAWHGRPGYGRSRGLPPGSLGIGGSIRSLVDDRFYLTQAARHGPVFKAAQFHRPVVCIVGVDRAARLIREHEDDLVAPQLAFSRAIPRGFLRYMSFADHTRYSPALQSALSRDVVQRCEPFVRSTFAAALERMARASAASPAGVDPRAEIRPALFAVLARVLFGIVPGTPLFERLEDACRGVDHRGAGRRARRAHARCVARVADVLRDAAAAARPEDAGTGTYVLDELLRAAPRALDDATIVGNLVFVLKLAHDNVCGLCVWIVKTVGDHPDCLARLRALRATAPDAAEALARGIVLETLRLEQSEYIYRVAVRDLRFDGFVIPAGWFVRVCVRESHRIPAVFADPDRFDPDRFASAAPSAAIYAPFGLGRHGCIGGHLATTVARILVEELAGDRVWRVSADGSRTRVRWRHWGHWMPSPALRIRVAPGRDGGAAC